MLISIERDSEKEREKERERERERGGGFLPSYVYRMKVKSKF